MAHLALYRKWRPDTFSRVCGQDPITSVLSYQVKNGKTSHAYLFTGSRGTGKTSCAKILAKAVNCLDPIDGNPCGKCEACLAIASDTATDIVEMDAASNNGVEYIRDIREEVVYTPAMLKNRVYIIDEVHMLSQSAFNALLKTLEEPPERVIFILATTELHKIPATILSRCQRFDFKRLRAADIADHLAMIAKEEGMDADPEALFRIAILAQGGMRDAISMLELCAAGGNKITLDLVQETAGVSGFDQLYRTAKCVQDKDFETLFSIVSDLYRTCRDPSVFLQDLVGFYRDMLVVKSTKHPDSYLELSAKEMELLTLCANGLRKEAILLHSRILDDAFLRLSTPGADKRLVLEMTLLRLCDDKLSSGTDAILSRISALEEAILSGATPSALPTPPSPPKKAPAVPEKTAVETPKKTAPPPPQPRPAKSSPPRPIPDFIEAVRAMEQSDMSAASILKMAKATLADGEDTVHVTVENDFYRMMLDKASVKENLLRILPRLESLKGVTLSDVVIQLAKNGNASDELPDLDEFD